MTFPKFVLLILVWLARATIAHASPFFIEYLDQDWAQNEKSKQQFEKDLIKSYNFVTSKIFDRIDRSQCRIKIIFRDLEGKHYASIPNEVAPCNEVISIEKNLNREKVPIYLIHELTHILRRQYNKYEERWLDEGLANLMMYLNLKTWPTSIDERIKKKNDFTITTDYERYNIRNTSGYDTSTLLLFYLYNRLGGEEFLKYLLQSEKSGWANIESAAADISKNKKIDGKINRQFILASFSIALLFNSDLLGKHTIYSIDYNYTPLIDLKNYSFNDVPLLNSNSLPSEFENPFNGRIKYFTKQEVVKKLSTSKDYLNYYFVGMGNSVNKKITLKKIKLNEFDDNLKEHKKWVLIQIAF